MSDGFSNSVIAGAETIARTGMKSLNYVAGVFGWRLDRDGDADLNNVNVRGDLTVTGANGASVTITNPNNAKILIDPPTMTTPGLGSNPGQIFAFQGDFANGQGFLRLFSPEPTIGALTGIAAELALISGDPNGTIAPAVAVQDDFSVGGITILNGLVNVYTGIVDVSGLTYLKGERGVKVVTFAALLSTTVAVTFTQAYLVAPTVTVGIDDNTAATIRWTVNATAITTTGFTLRIANPAGAAASAWTNISVRYIAVEEG